jgi:hypothetical protein
MLAWSPALVNDAVPVASLLMLIVTALLSPVAVSALPTKSPSKVLATTFSAPKSHSFAVV